MSLIALKFVLAALIALLLFALTWLAAELRQAPREVKTMVKWILGVAAVMIVAALAGPIVYGFWWWWWSFGSGVYP
jgi:hypothetical protein